MHRANVVVHRAALLLAALVPSAHAHHAMDYVLPATAAEGLLSGLGHPIIGIDHLLFIIGAGVLAARMRRGVFMPLVFVLASIIAAGTRVGGTQWEMGEIWVAGSLFALGAIMIRMRDPQENVTAVLFLLAGAIHGYALAAAIVGAEPTPLVAYFTGLTLIQCAIALAAWAAARWLAARHPQLALQRLAGAAVAAAGLLFGALAVMG